ncbi:hypothetical protein MNB_SV-4-1207 [hydrothermal vent metagenome]|uniref:Uncharacterized protein n=1 Tax=hydrothermal vent metagenome TaxID=652676 RepID=A0A1W1E845_9ZZZZ
MRYSFGTNDKEKQPQQPQTHTKNRYRKNNGHFDYYRFRKKLD